MDVSDATAISSAVIALGSAAIALRANSFANKSNRLASDANTLAEDAITEARGANAFAEKANDIALEANRISDRALRAARDDVPYNWVLSVDDNGSAWVKNDCGHTARQVTAIIDCGGRIVGENEPKDLAPFGELFFDLKESVEQHLAQVRLYRYQPGSSGGGIVVAGSNGRPYETTFRAHLRWLTNEEVPRSDVVEDTLRHHMTYDGMKRSKPRAK